MKFSFDRWVASDVEGLSRLIMKIGELPTKQIDADSFLQLQFELRPIEMRSDFKHADEIRQGFDGTPTGALAMSQRFWRRAEVEKSFQVMPTNVRREKRALIEQTHRQEFFAWEIEQCKRGEPRLDFWDWYAERESAPKPRPAKTL